MPNWCQSNITFYSKDKSVIEDFHKKLTEWTDAPSLAPTAWDGDSSWLGNILLRAGYKSFEIEEDGFPKHRGNVTDIFGIEEKEQGVDKYWYFDMKYDPDNLFVPEKYRLWATITETKELKKNTLLSLLLLQKQIITIWILKKNCLIMLSA